MKNKILSCLLAVMMITSLLAVPVFAESDVINVTGNSFTIKNISYAAGASKTFEVNIAKAGSYYMSFVNSSHNSIAVEVNGEQVSRYTATDVASASPYTATIFDEVYFTEGLNTIKFFAARNYDISVDSVTFTKIENEQYTATAQTYMGAAAAIETTLPAGSGMPWYDFSNVAVDSAASVTFNVEVKTDGYYSPAVFINGNVDTKLTINNKVIEIPASTPNPEAYRAGATGAAVIYVRPASSGLYLTAGTYPVKIELANPAEDATKWSTKIGGVRLYKAISSSDGKLTLENISYVSGASKTYQVYMEEAGSHYMSFVNSSHNSIAVEVNGESISRYTATDVASANPYTATIFDEVYFTEGLNTIKFFAARNYDISVDSVTFTKLENEQYTATAQNYTGAASAVETTLPTGSGMPWYDFSNVAVDSAASVTFNVEVKTDGYYSPAVFINGNVDTKLTINNKVIEIPASTPNPESYRAGATGAAVIYVRPASSGLYLTAGTYPVKIELANPAEDATKWSTKIGGVRLYKAMASADGELIIENISYASGASKTFKAYIEEAGSYYMSFVNSSHNSIAVEINGESISRYNASNAVSANPYTATILDEVYFTEGLNTIKFFAARNYDISVDSVTFTKLETEQYTVTAQNYMGAGAATSTTVAGGNPWYDFAATPITTAASTTFDLTVSTDGYYIPAAIVNGSDDVKLTINNQIFNIPATTATSETVRPGGQNGAMAYVRPAQKGIRLTAGTYSVKIELISAASEATATWKTKISGARVYKAEEPEAALEITNTSVMYGAVTVDYIAPVGKEFYIIVGNSTEAEGGNILVNMAIPVKVTGTGSADSETIMVGTEGEIYEVFIWENLTGIKPLLEKISLTDPNA